MKKSKLKPCILVSNDDGVLADGLKILVREMKKLGRVIVVAPDSQRSAASQSITLHRPLRVNKLETDVYSIDGTPTDCIIIGINEVMKCQPDLIVSGINHGANLGDDVHYSGTVSAAFEGGLLGVPSMAVSQDSTNGTVDFHPAAAFARKVAAMILKKGLPSGVILNVNVPNVPRNKIKGYLFTKQGKRNYGGIIVEKVDPRGRKYYWIGGNQEDFEDIKGSDSDALRRGYISISPLIVDLTSDRTLSQISDWKI